MALTPSTMLELGTLAPDFQLSNGVDKETYRFSDIRGKEGTLVMFACNHCPYVNHIQSELGNLGNELLEKKFGVVAINSNDVDSYPEDSPALMKDLAKKEAWNFPYLLDASQETAKEYRAACTPDFYLFDRNQKLVYRGQMDDSRPGNGVPVTGKDLREAVDLLLRREDLPKEQKPSVGCNIKWKPGNAPSYS